MTQEAVDADPPKNVVAVVVSKNFPDAKMIRERLEQGIEKLPDAVWVMREQPRADHAASIAWAVLREHGIEPILSPAPSAVWGTGHARQWADAELRHTCYRILVFHDGRSETTKDWTGYAWRHDPYDPAKLPCRARIFVIERGKAAKKRKARKRVDV